MSNDRSSSRLRAPPRAVFHRLLKTCTTIHSGTEALVYNTDRATLLRLWPDLLGEDATDHTEYVIKKPNRHEDFLSERLALELCNKRSSNHIVLLVGSFENEEGGYLILLRAIADLETLWGHGHPVAPSLSLRSQEAAEKWFEDQMFGLAEALTNVHCHLGTAENPVFGIHGDIKASNVLFYKALDNTMPGTLKLADFGASQFFDSLATASATCFSAGNGSYTAPESALEQPQSQAVDVWSLGCLMLECIVWSVEGPDGRLHFAQSRRHQSHPYGLSLTADYFFRMEPAINDTSQSKPFVTEVNPAVTERINLLKDCAHAPAKRVALLSLIQKRMLMVNPRERITSAGASEELRFILYGEYNQ
ncbi:uncharacterized protein HMPREF1541_01893 [Cyphellophora europaea CBS 101466]|uniref:Protein kinase domain-containing protein n=1 Tax=Cyphellophora europaea (strain CBS 101466) TaxID=1220924 RepID=W2S2C2_CYPE1|nr:uncharacterized protein HMPREF1541_01893 [Cyphellophora europaea CBS 101466]ETN42735.1 hypothetical protein HMPREF1541_01893 [Cyphellophora europaea CBS 101466]